MVRLPLMDVFVRFLFGWTEELRGKVRNLTNREKEGIQFGR